METHRKLYRSNERRIVGGVAGGLAEYFNIDPLIVRLLFAVGLFFGGATLLAYLVMWFCIPRDPLGDTGRSSTFGLLFKGVAILACVGIIASQFDSEFWVGGFAIGLCIGLYFYWRSRRDDSDDEPAYESLNRTRLYRSTSDKKILGVFGGIASAINADPTLLRVGGVVLLVMGFPVILPLYLLAGLLLPKPDVVIRIE